MYWSEEVYKIYQTDPKRARNWIAESLDCYIDNKQQMQQAFEKCLEQGESYDIVSRLKTFSGAIIWVRTTGQPVYQDKTITGVVGNIADITKAKLAEIELLNSQQLIKGFLDNLPAVAYFKDMQGRYQLLNKSWSQYTGINADDAIGKTDQEIWPIEVPELVDNDAQVLEEGTALAYEEQTCSAQGVISTLMSHKFPLLDAQENVIGLGAVSVDISNLKRAEQELHDSQRQLELSMVGANAGLWDWDSNKESLQTNHIWAEMLGYSKQELDDQFGNKYERWAQLVHPEDLEEAVNALQSHIFGYSETYRAEFRMKTKSGDWKWILGVGKAFERNSENLASRVLGIQFDIDESKNLQKQLQSQQEQLRALFAALPGRRYHDFSLWRNHRSQRHQRTNLRAANKPRHFKNSRFKSMASLRPARAKNGEGRLPNV